MNNFDEMCIQLPKSTISGVLNKDDGTVECYIKDGFFSGIKYKIIFDEDKTTDESLCFEVEVLNKQDLYNYAKKVLEYIITKDMYERLKRK